MNYKHAYHAGNFADVAKHCLLLQLLTQFNQKAKPFYVLDAYGGRGLYSLASMESQKTSEAVGGIFVLQQAQNTATQSNAPPAAVCLYLDDLAKAKKLYDKHVFTGSPYIIANYAKNHSTAPMRCEAFEMVTSEYDALNYQLHQLPIGIHHRDAFEGIPAVIPPQEKRGIVLLDPPFEQEHKDFNRLVDLLVRCHDKWATGTYVLWYPIKNKAAVDLFYKKMKRTHIKKQLLCELRLYPDDIGIGLNGTGLHIINPPYRFEQFAQEILNYLAHVLQPKDSPAMTLGEKVCVQWLVGE